MATKWCQNGDKMAKKWRQMEQNGEKMAIKWGQNGDKMAKKWRQMDQNGDKMR